MSNLTPFEALDRPVLMVCCCNLGIFSEPRGHVLRIRVDGAGCKRIPLERLSLINTSGVDVALRPLSAHHDRLLLVIRIKEWDLQKDRLSSWYLVLATGFRGEDPGTLHGDLLGTPFSPHPISTFLDSPQHL